MLKAISRISSRIPCAIAVLFCIVSCSSAEQVNTLRAPAYPLITIDPYTSAWSAADHLYDTDVTHWTGRPFPFDGILTVDGKDWRFMGSDAKYVPLAESVLTGDWESEQMHMERSFILESIPEGPVYCRHSCRQKAKFYINGEEAINADRKRTGQIMLLTDKQKALLHPGENVISGSCTNRRAERNLYFELFKRLPDTDNKAVQTLADVQATQTRYRFQCGPVELELTFTAPMLPQCPLLVSRPVNYVTYTVSSTDGRAHELSMRISADASGWTVNTPDQCVTTELVGIDGLSAVRGGSIEQDILGKKGDDIRIDWGYLYLAAPSCVKAEAKGTLLCLTDDMGSASKASGHCLVAYDDLWSVHYFGENLRPYWNRDGNVTFESVLLQAENEYRRLMAECRRFDSKLFADAVRAGGVKYAELCALAYRHCIAAHKLVQLPNGDMALFSKENNSNGSIGTVDVTYPSSPLFLKYNPDLCAALLNHIFDYSERGLWTKPFPAHDVGTYPVAAGQTYAHDMPVEEGGNMLILTAAVCKQKKDWAYAGKHWETLSVWAKYLEDFGMDPEDQLCTDDFAGKMAHNANLSIKAILGIAAYSQMAAELGMDDVAAQKRALAVQYAARWEEMADDGDHYSLTFDRKGTWSQKYNLVWDSLNGFHERRVRVHDSSYLEFLQYYRGQSAYV